MNVVGIDVGTTGLKAVTVDREGRIVRERTVRYPTELANGGRPRIDDRAVLTGILFVLKSGIPWEMLPQEMGCGSGMTC